MTEQNNDSTQKQRRFWISERQLDQLYDIGFDRADWGEKPHDNSELNKLCSQITDNQKIPSDFPEEWL